MTQTPVQVEARETNPIVDAFAHFWSDPDPALIAPALAEDVVLHVPGEIDIRGPDAYVAQIAHYLKSYGGLRLRVAEHAQNGDMTFIRWIARAEGADGPYEFSGIDRIVVQEDGRVKENFVSFDRLTTWMR